MVSSNKLFVVIIYYGVSRKKSVSQVVRYRKESIVLSIRVDGNPSGGVISDDTEGVAHLTSIITERICFIVADVIPISVNRPG